MTAIYSGPSNSIRQQTTNDRGRLQQLAAAVARAEAEYNRSGCPIAAAVWVRLESERRKLQSR